MRARELVLENLCTAVIRANGKSRLVAWFPGARNRGYLGESRIRVAAIASLVEPADILDKKGRGKLAQSIGAIVNNN